MNYGSSSQDLQGSLAPASSPTVDRLGQPALEGIRPRVVMLGPLPPPPGGMATVMANLADSRLANDCQLVLIDTAKRTTEGRNVWAAISYQLKLLWRVVSAIWRTHAQIVHIHTCSGFTFWRDVLHMMAARIMGCRVVWHIHGGFFDRFVAAMPSAGACLYRSVLQKSDAVIVLSSHWRHCLNATARNVHWKVVANGTSIPTDSCRPSCHTTFLFIGNITVDKGVAELIQAFARLRSRNIPCKLLLVGNGPASDECESLIRSLKCADDIEMPGVLEGLQKRQAFEAAGCFVLPSKAEGLPMAMLEAMACGLPVIATSVGGIPEAVTDGQEGYLVPPQDVDTLADRMSRLATDAGLREQMGRKARKRVVTEFSLGEACDRILDVYQSILRSDLDQSPRTRLQGGA